MRRVILALAALVIWFSGGSGTAMADGMMLPLPGAVGSAFVAVRYHHVEVRIEDGHAVTRVAQEFYNPHDVPVQGQYLFPIPPEAMLTRFQATVDGQPQVMRRQDPATTNHALNTVVVQHRDPSLLEYFDWESLALDLDLPPGGSRKMNLEYEEVLAPSGGLYRYRYVLGTERYSALPLEEVSVEVEIESSSGLASLYSPSHAVVTERLGPAQAQVQWEATDVRPTEDFELFYAPAESGFGGGLLTGQRGDHDHFLFTFSPSLEQRQAETLPKDIVLVIDQSGSMDGEKMEQAKNALHFVLGQLGKQDRFSIVAFDDHVSALDWQLRPADERWLGHARSFVDNLAADGSTNLEAALQAGLEILDQGQERAAPRMVIFLTDGLPTAGITDEALIAQLTGRANAEVDARLHVFGVGYDVNSHLLDRLASENGGTVTYVQPGENLAAALTEFYSSIARPVLTNVEIEFEGLNVSHLYPTSIPDLFQGSSLLLTGRYQARKNEATVRIRGWAGKEQREYVYHFDLAETGGRHFVPRLWATRRIGVLLDQIRVEGESQSSVTEVRDLGLSYGLVTPYTTFVIQGQAEGAASADNMALYGHSEVNQASGQTTIMARVQNQAYQQAAQANLATGANVYNRGKRSLAQMGAQSLDLSLLLGHSDSDTWVDGAWIGDNVDIDRTIPFGSEAYFALVRDPDARPFLQSGANVIFAYKGEVIAIEDEPQDRLQDAGHSDQKQILADGGEPQDSGHASRNDMRVAPSSNALARWVEMLVRVLASASP